MPGIVVSTEDTEVNKMTKSQLQILGGKIDHQHIKIQTCPPCDGL